MPPSDVDPPLDPNDPLSVMLLERRKAKQSVIKPGNTTAFLPTETDNLKPQSAMRPLPACCTGAAGMSIPPYITGSMSSVTLPSRLNVLGRREFNALSVLDLHHVGNSVLGYAPIINFANLAVKGRRVIKRQLFFLPSIFTRSTAYIIPFLKLLVAVIVVVAAMDFFGVEFTVGYLWIIPTALSLWSQMQLAKYKSKADGVMAFCRSLGTPAIEEYMFSYAWKHQAENVRTLAKALWSSNVGCWIDVVKLTPGDEIRPMLRTVVARVYRCVVFLCPEYIASPNCCIELAEAVQRPDKLLFCILKPLPAEFDSFLSTLELEGAKVVRGVPELCKQLNAEMNDQDNISYYRWWQSQAISGAGVPEVVVPTSSWPIPRFSLRGRLFLPEKTLAVGPVFLAGDCSDTGMCVAIPWLLLAVLVAVGVCAWIITDVLLADWHDLTIIDFLLLSCVLAINICPILLGGQDLLDTRRFIHANLRPLLASRAVGGGVLVEIIGNRQDFIVQILNKFLGLIGHLKPSPEELQHLWSLEVARNRLYDLNAMRTSQDERSTQRERERRVQFQEYHARLRTRHRVLRIVVMDSLESREQYFGEDEDQEMHALKDSSTIYIWSGAGDPFTKDKSQFLSL